MLGRLCTALGLIITVLFPIKINNAIQHTSWWPDVPKTCGLYMLYDRFLEIQWAVQMNPLASQPDVLILLGKNHVQYWTNDHIWELRDSMRHRSTMKVPTLFGLYSLIYTKTYVVVMATDTHDINKVNIDSSVINQIVEWALVITQLQRETRHDLCRM